MRAGHRPVSASDELGQERAYAPPGLGESPPGQGQAEFEVAPEKADPGGSSAPERKQPTDGESGELASPANTRSLSSLRHTEQRSAPDQRDSGAVGAATCGDGLSRPAGSRPTPAGRIEGGRGRGAANREHPFLERPHGPPNSWCPRCCNCSYASPYQVTPVTCSSLQPLLLITEPLHFFPDPGEGLLRAAGYSL